MREPLPGCLKQFQSTNILTSRQCFGCSGVHCAPGPLCPPGVWSVSSDSVSTSGLPQVCLCHFWWITLNFVLQHPWNSVSFSSSGRSSAFPWKAFHMSSGVKGNGRVSSGPADVLWDFVAELQLLVPSDSFPGNGNFSEFKGSSFFCLRGSSSSNRWTMLALKTEEWHISFYPPKGHTKATRRISCGYTHFFFIKQELYNLWVKHFPRGLMMPARAWQESQTEDSSVK